MLPQNRGLNVAIAALFGAQVVACAPQPSNRVNISPTDLAAQLENQTAPLILDVRSSEEYAAGHIPGAINIDFRELEDRWRELPIAQDEAIVVYCERGVRSGVAETTLQEAGFTQVLHLEGDMAVWRDRDLPIEQGETATNQGDAQTLEQYWWVSATEAKDLIDQGATFLDARGKRFLQKQLQGAIAVQWQTFSPAEGSDRGNLLADDARLTEKLQGIGISANRPVVVFGNPAQGWGEEGRIVWMLRTLGHSQAVMVDGGFAALIAANIPVQTGKPEQPTPGNFVVQRRATWDIQQDELKAQLDASAAIVVDTREPREFAGATPYGEQRGGHLPGAVNLYFKNLLTPDGRLLPPAELQNQLTAQGITPDKPIIVYCTGGIRSGWMAAVLVSLGYEVKNYAGSMWEWSAAPAADYPLEVL